MSAKTYIGTKVVYAEPMTRLEYNKYRGWELPSDENGEDKGFLVEYADGGKSNVPDRKGYVSWSPEDVFNRSYHVATAGLSDFGTALKSLLCGLPVARLGWNGKGMFIRFVPTTAELNQHFEIKNVRGTYDTWVPSVSDLLANDWITLSKGGGCRAQKAGSPARAESAKAKREAVCLPFSLELNPEVRDLLLADLVLEQGLEVHDLASAHFRGNLVLAEVDRALVDATLWAEQGDAVLDDAGSKKLALLVTGKLDVHVVCLDDRSELGD